MRSGGQERRVLEHPGIVPVSSKGGEGEVASLGALASRPFGLLGLRSQYFAFSPQSLTLLGCYRRAQKV